MKMQTMSANELQNLLRISPKPEFSSTSERNVSSVSEKREYFMKSLPSIVLLVFLGFGPYVFLCISFFYANLMTVVGALLYVIIFVLLRRDGVSRLIAARPHTSFQDRVYKFVSNFAFYQLPWWIVSAHTSSLLYSLFPKIHSPKLIRQWGMTANGCTLALDWHIPVETIHGVVLVLPGLFMHSATYNIRQLMHQFGKANLTTCCLVNNGDLNTPTLKPQGAIHIARVDDVLNAINSIEEITKSYGIPIYLVGLSAGGCRAVNFVATSGESLIGRVMCCVDFSGPMRSPTQYESRLSTAVYQPYVVNELVSSIHSSILKHPESPVSPTSPRLKKMKTFTDFTEGISMPVLGFQTENDYKNSTYAFEQNKWRNIAIPTLIVHAADDPLIPVDSAIVTDISYENSNVFQLITKYGGHLGWQLTFNLGLHDDQWMGNVALSFINATTVNNN